MPQLNDGESDDSSVVSTPQSRAAIPAIAFDNVAMQRRGRLVWSMATFSIKQGECVALLGPNGSGKTTMLRVILGQLTPTAGQVTVLGAPPHPGNRAIGLVPQRRELISELSIRSRDLVLLGINGYRWGFGRARPAELRQMARALQAVGALDFADEPVGSLSGGQQQRVALARALVIEPTVFVSVIGMEARNRRRRSSSSTARGRTATGPTARRMYVTEILATGLPLRPTHCYNPPD